MTDKADMLPEHEEALRDAVGLMRALARDDDRAAKFVACNISNPRLTALLLASMVTASYARCGDPAELIEEFAERSGLA